MGGDRIPFARDNVMKNMNLLAGALTGLGFAAVPAAADVPLVNSPITVTTADVGKAFTYNFNGIVDEVEQPGLAAAITFTLTGFAGNAWTFSAAINNNLLNTPVAGRITSFGFNSMPDISAVTLLSGPFMASQLNGSFPQTGGGTTIDFCLEDQAGGGCGGGGNGVFNNTSALQSFTLTLAGAPTTSATFNNFILRWQSVAGNFQGTSGIGLGTGGGGFDGGGDPGVPEPATWAMLLSGFGMVGFAARRRRARLSVSA